MNKRITILLLSVIALAACSTSETCLISNDVAMQIVLYTDTIDSLDNHNIFTLPADSITVKGMNNDSLLYDNAKNISTIALPLQNSQTTTTYIITINGKTDTVEIKHRNEDLFVSLECGYFTYHDIRRVMTTNHIFDSIKLIETDVERIQTENIRFYWH